MSQTGNMYDLLEACNRAGHDGNLPDFVFNYEKFPTGKRFIIYIIPMFDMEIM